MKKTLRRASLLVLSVVALALPVSAWFYRQNIYDWARLHNYQVPTAIAQLATDDTMTSGARRLFYVNHPAIEASSDFNKSCPENGGEQTIVLGCYHGLQTGIFLYDVKDTKLAGVVQVTAAHEILHAEYDRLSVKEKQYVNGLLEDYYKQLKDDRLLKTIAAYRQSEPADVVNEMHSIFGTEVMDLPAPLENYYKQYFTDRKKVVSFSEQYQAAFTTRRERVASDDIELKNLKTQIDEIDASLKTQSDYLISQRQYMNQLLQKNQLAEYNALVPGYNQKVTSYNNDVATERQLVAQYNAVVAERNTLALEENELIKAINSRPDTLNSQ